MRFLEITLPTITENLALDEVLLLEAEAGHGGEMLRIWEWPSYAVVLGSGGKLAEDVDEDACRAEGVPILRRSSGGGTVLLGPGCLLFSLILSYESSPAFQEIASSYLLILGRMRDALTALLPGIELAGTSDLTVGGRKFSGNSQQRKRSYLLHHGTLLYDFDLTRIGTYLRMPAKQPDYRGGRTHLDFLINLPATAVDLLSRLRKAWGAVTESPDWPRDAVRRLVVEKYESPTWIARR
jgi:lipoate-protein ligase A